MANWILYGVLLVQICAFLWEKRITVFLPVPVDLYYTAFPKDRRPLKLIVFMQLLLDTTQTAIFTNEVIHQFMDTNPDVFNEIGTFWFSVPLMIGLSTHMLDYAKVNHSLI